MLRIILGAIAGFIIWSILWVGSDFILSAISPDWWGKHLNEMQGALENKNTFQYNSLSLVLVLIRSFICSLASGYTAALIAGENRKAPLTAGILLLAFGIFIQSIYWDLLPLWYHIPFLLMLIPFTILGGKLRKSEPAKLRAVEI